MLLLEHDGAKERAIKVADNQRKGIIIMVIIALRLCSAVRLRQKVILVTELFCHS
jgi:hypothetical protein